MHVNFMSPTHASGDCIVCMLVIELVRDTYEGQHTNSRIQRSM